MKTLIPNPERPRPMQILKKRYDIWLFLYLSIPLLLTIGLIVTTLIAISNY